MTTHKQARLARRIVDAFKSDFTDRRGLRQEWDQIDEDIQADIDRKWIALVLAELSKP